MIFCLKVDIFEIQIGKGFLIMQDYTQQINEIGQQMISRIDATDGMEVQKVKRYTELLKMDLELSDIIKEHGPMIIIETEGGVDIRKNPAVNERIKISKELVSVEKSIKFIHSSSLKQISSSSTVEELRGELF